MAIGEIIGIIATVITTVYTVLGIPSQLIKNYKNKSVTGVSLFMSIMLVFVFLSWVLYALVKEDYYILISNAPGFIGSMILILQFYFYKKTK
jgi:MtN3 and saliva related transmembrane protein